MGGVRGLDRGGRQSRSGCQEVKLEREMERSEETQEVRSVFRPWDSRADSEERKPLGSAKPSLRLKQEPSLTVRPALRPKLEPAVINPLSIAMRGLVPALPLPHLSLMQRRAVQELQDLQELQLAVAQVSERKARPKRYKCDLCEACFSNNGQLKGHVRIHTGQSQIKIMHQSFDQKTPVG